MKRRLLTYEDGRLKTGRVALLVFIMIMVGCALAYKLSKPVDQVMIAVKHVFEAEQVETAEPETPDEKSQEKSEEVSKEKAQEEQKSEQKQEIKESGEKTDESQKSSGKQAAEDQPVTAQPSDMEKKEPAAPQPSQAKAPGPEKPETDSAQPPPVEPLKVVQAEPAVQSQNTGEAAPVKIGKDATQPIKFTPMSTGSPEKKEPAGEVTLASSDYMGVYKSWQKAGEQGGGGNIPLRIENLRNVYKLFQMKAIALKDGEPYADLSDSSRIAPAALDVYASTCFVASNPFSKFNDELVKAGLRGKRVEVRYYMYDFIRNSIYARANRAVECCRQKGLIPADTPASSVDLLGRAYAIRKKGGGGFGVFVPTRIDLPDGRTVSVDPSCFKGSQDIDHLISAGLLK